MKKLKMRDLSFLLSPTVIVGINEFSENRELEIYLFVNIWGVI